ncbi:pentapeptide repeat-containing protein [Leptolyngbya sp. FACHB-541]|uniref:pentapeptide repeat-containing protein n=1 Tax=Leptolyngbya sp. FACHB-541 TaxID=2692810 RepID=UPI0016840DA2|nr:pentapeptide repeat-containing protein [Leptolyngbya sp. FACHB-541]MBD2000217.1 pentapeptide repeat-containing protein [Leptolyngbya sp. FACHB-541]
MTRDSNLSKSDSPPIDETEYSQAMPSDSLNGADRELVSQSVADANYQSTVANKLVADNQDDGRAAINYALKQDSAVREHQNQPPYWLIILMAIAIMTTGLIIGNFWLGVAGAAVAFLASLKVVWAPIKAALAELISEQQWQLTIATLGLVFALLGILILSGVPEQLQIWWSLVNWEATGALGEVLGALGQILIAILAVYVAWRQYVISKDLTIQQNLITQQQTIDTYFQGISDLVLDEEGLLEDWPQERAIAEGRTAAILSSVDAGGKAKVVRFLSRSRLLTPLMRDRRLGRAMLDGVGGYQEDRNFGIRVIDLGVMLAAADLSGTDLRWTDLSDANLIRANLGRCDLVKTNLSRTILVDANLTGADLMGTRLFYGPVSTATPRSRTEIPDYITGTCTGAVIENADLTGVQRMSDEQRQYCCAWGGSKTRSTIPGGCDGIANKLGR